jgi:hypothetical protein
LQNDITINEISRVQYRVDGGAWQTATEVHQPTATLDVTVPLPAGATIEIRAIDDVTGVATPVFHGNTERPSATPYPGISGFVWDDSNANGQWDAGEVGLSGMPVQLVDHDGNVLDLRRRIEPDDYPDEATVLNQAIPQVTLSATGAGVADSSISSRAAAFPADGNRVFATFVKPVSGSYITGFSAEWTGTTRQLRMHFNETVATVSIDAVADSDGDFGRLEIYNAQDQLLGRYTTQGLAQGSIETMTLSRGEADIAYAIARSQGKDPADGFENRILLDNLQFGSESVVYTDQHGAYAFPYLLEGDYTVQVVATGNQANTTPSDGAHAVQLATGQSLSQIDFGLAFEGSAWQNPTERCDVNADGTVSPIDALQIINDINDTGVREISNSDPPPPPYLDVSGDGVIAPGDVLLVINEIHYRNKAEAEGELYVGGGSRAEEEDPEGEEPLRPLMLGIDLLFARSPNRSSASDAEWLSRFAVEEESSEDSSLETALDALAADVSPFWYV